MSPGQRSDVGYVTSSCPAPGLMVMLEVLDVLSLMVLMFVTICIQTQSLKKKKKFKSEHPGVMSSQLSSPSGSK